jgi:glycosyltransferase involved in cell wall biosynthesis
LTVRILFVCPDMRTGGAERHWAMLAPALRARGAVVRVLCLAEEGGLFGDLAAAGVPAACARMRRRTDLAGWRRSLQFAEPRPDVVVTRGVSGQLVGELIARRSRAPHVMNEHTPLTPAGELLPMRPHQRLLTRLVARRVDRVIAVTQSQVEPLARLGYRHERIEVVPNGVFGAGTAGDAAATRSALGIQNGEFAVLCVAGLRPEKGVEVFIRAVAAARHADPRLRGFVAGDGPERRRLEALARVAGVELLGVRADVPELMRATDALALTSEGEALPMSVLEAMALERPVIVTDVGGTKEAVVDGETGLVVPAGDPSAARRALLELASDPERARRLGAAGRARQRELFDGDTMADRYLAALEKAARGR